MYSTMDHASWITQLRKGAVDAAVLGVLSREKHAYGLAILDHLNAVGLTVSEGALYPLLARLGKADLVSAQWRLDEGAPHPRKYYALTQKGAALFSQMQASWPEFARQIGVFVNPEETF